MAGIGERYLRRRKSIAESQVQGLLQKVRFCNRLCIFLPIPGRLRNSVCAVQPLMLQLFPLSYLLLVLPEIGRFPEVSA